jgi:hypothetical protein
MGKEPGVRYSRPPEQKYLHKAFEQVWVVKNEFFEGPDTEKAFPVNDLVSCSCRPNSQSGWTPAHLQHRVSVEHPINNVYCLDSISRCRQK